MSKLQELESVPVPGVGLCIGPDLLDLASNHSVI